MNKGVVNLSIVAVKKEASHTSEMTNQLLFGDTVEILDKHENWLYIQSDYDGYCGWILNSHVINLTDEQFTIFKENSKWVTSDFINHLSSIISDTDVTLFAGSTLAFNDAEEVILGDEIYICDDEVSKPVADLDLIIGSAMMFNNVPYLWGGRSFAGIDCSGLTQIVFKINGIKLFRDAHQQAEQGETINMINEALVGDLFFFDNDEGKITHVGIYLGDNKIIHASGRVRIDTIDHQGIFNNELNTYTHKLRLIKRML